MDVILIIIEIDFSQRLKSSRSEESATI